MTEPAYDDTDDDYPAEHPRNAKGEPYSYGGYAYLRRQCRCPGCKAEIAAQAKRAGAANAAKTRKAPNRAAVTDVSAPATERAGAAVHDLTGLLGPRPATKVTPGGASQKDIHQFLAQLLAYCSIGGVMLMTRGMGLPAGTIDTLALADEEAEAISAPFARLAAGSRLNNLYGKSIIENSDVLGAAFAVMAYTRRSSEALAQLRRQQLDYLARTTHPAYGGTPHGPAREAAAPDTAATPGPTFVARPYEPGDQLRAD